MAYTPNTTTFRGNWLASIPYSKNDITTDAAGNLYLANYDNVGETPSTTGEAGTATLNDADDVAAVKLRTEYASGTAIVVKLAAGAWYGTVKTVTSTTPLGTWEANHSYVQGTLLAANGTVWGLFKTSSGVDLHEGASCTSGEAEPTWPAFSLSGGVGPLVTDGTGQWIGMATIPTVDEVVVVDFFSPGTFGADIAAVFTPDPIHPGKNQWGEPMPSTSAGWILFDGYSGSGATANFMTWVTTATFSGGVAGNPAWTRIVNVPVV